VEQSIINSGIKSSMYGLIVGDALGVPVEFWTREELEKNPVKGMRGFGTHDKPEGTWSDDSSMMLATASGLCGEFEPVKIMDNFLKWVYCSKFTADGDVFDIGMQTSDSLTYYAKHKEVKESIGNPANGSLMRILPVGLKFYNLSAGDIKKLSFGISSLTHNHILCKLSCFYYCLFISFLMRSNNVDKAYSLTNKKFRSFLPEKEEKTFEDILSGKLKKLNKKDILSTGHVIPTLRASLWCVLNNDNYRDSVLDAVNLGGDTDTIGAITGGMAGLAYGDIPVEWLESIRNRMMIDEVIDKFILEVV